MVNKRTGFMLIELAVASFVIGVAILGLMAVARIGQRAAENTVEETRISAFADEVMTTLDILSERAAEDPDQNAWIRFWVDLANDKNVITQLTCFASGVWTAPLSGTYDMPTLHGGDFENATIHTNFWCYEEYTDAVHVYDYALQYRLIIANGLEQHKPLTYDATNDPPRFVSVSLMIWNGAYRSSTRNGSFYRIFANKGRLQ